MDCSARIMTGLGVTLKCEYFGRMSNMSEVSGQSAHGRNSRMGFGNYRMVTPPFTQFVRLSHRGIPFTPSTNPQIPKSITPYYSNVHRFLFIRPNQLINMRESAKGLRIGVCLPTFRGVPTYKRGCQSLRIGRAQNLTFRVLCHPSQIP